MMLCMDVPCLYPTFNLLWEYIALLVYHPHCFFLLTGANEMSLGERVFND